MNPRITLQFKSVCGVVQKGFHVSFDEGCIRCDIWKIKLEKWVKIPIMGTFRGVLPVGLKSYR